MTSAAPTSRCYEPSFPSVFYVPSQPFPAHSCLAVHLWPVQTTSPVQSPEALFLRRLPITAGFSGEQFALLSSLWFL